METHLRTVKEMTTCLLEFCFHTSHNIRLFIVPVNQVIKAVCCSASVWSSFGKGAGLGRGGGGVGGGAGLGVVFTDHYILIIVPYID